VWCYCAVLLSSVNGQPISGTQEFKNALAQLAGGQVFPIVVERKGGPVTVQVLGADWPQ
jgi:S1-C subfamily serine protease